MTSTTMPVAKRNDICRVPPDGHPRPDAGRWCALCQAAEIAAACPRWLVAKGYAARLATALHADESEVDALNLVPDEIPRA